MNNEEKYTKKVWDERYKEGKIACTKKTGQGDSLDYTQHRFLYQHSIAKRLTGELDGNPMDIWGGKFFRTPAHSVLSIGSGLAYAEEELVQKGFAEHITIYEMSTEAVKAASERIKKDGLAEHFCFKNEDILEAKIEPNSYDAIFITAAIHHFFEIEKMFQLMHKVLKPNGLLVYDEYIGPDHNLYEPEVMNIMNEINGCLDEHYRYDCLRKNIREEVPEVTLEWMLKTDPSEGVHASMILPLTYRYFNVEFRGDYGGTIMRPFFTAILDNFDFNDYRDQTIARLIIYIEDILLKNGIIPNYHTLVVARKRDEPLDPCIPEQFARVNYSDWKFQRDSGIGTPHAKRSFPLWNKIVEHLVKKTRTNAGREESPSYAITDSQSVKTVAASEERGIDGGKK